MKTWLNTLQEVIKVKQKWKVKVKCYKFSQHPAKYSRQTKLAISESFSRFWSPYKVKINFQGRRELATNRKGRENGYGERNLQSHEQTRSPSSSKNYNLWPWVAISLCFNLAQKLHRSWACPYSQLWGAACISSITAVHGDFSYYLTKL